MNSRHRYKWFVAGDIDGFFGLAIDNLVQLLVINTLCKLVLGFPDELLYGKVLPGVAVSLVIGNVFYAWQAKKLAQKEQRTDVCALPYGINTPSVFAYIFLVMLPVKLAAKDGGATELEQATLAWQAGLVACLGSGLIELAGAFVAERIRKVTPRAALLSTLAGIAITFIAMPFIFTTFSKPIVGFTTLGIVMTAYFGGVKFIGRVPAGLLAVVVGTVLAMLTGLSPNPQYTPTGISIHFPVPVMGDVIEGLKNETLWVYLGVIIPMGLFNVIGSMQNIESAEAEGDLFPTAPSLGVNGIGTIIAGLFGSCFPTTIYIGHPGWKRLGARAGYSILNGVFISALCMFGLVSTLAHYVPIEAGMAIVVWIGIIITAQAFTATPKHHAPAVVVGLLPGIAAWGVINIKAALRMTEKPMFQGHEASTLKSFTDGSIDLHGGFALEQGFILTAMIFAAITVYVIERKFLRAGVVSMIAALLSAFGIMHAYKWTPADTVVNIGLPWDINTWSWVIGYCLMGLIFIITPTITRPDDVALK